MASVRHLTLVELELKREVGGLVQKYCDALTENYAKEGWERQAMRATYTAGRKYFKVLINHYLDGTFDRDCVLAFVDFKGDVYMSGSRLNCAKGVRYNITEPGCTLLDSRFTDWAGSHLYIHTVKKHRNK